MNDGGKGSARRPSDVPRSVVDDNWDRIFGKKKEAVPETKSKIRFREHRRSLDEAMETMVCFDNEADLKKHISAKLGINESAISFDEKVVYDERIDWHTQYVVIDNSWVFGMVDLNRDPQQINPTYAIQAQ